MPVPTALLCNKISPCIVVTNFCYIAQINLFVVLIWHLDILTVTSYDVYRRCACKSRNPSSFAKASNPIVQIPSTNLLRVLAIPLLHSIRKFSTLSGRSLMQRTLFLTKLFLSFFSYPFLSLLYSHYLRLYINILQVL